MLWKAALLWLDMFSKGTTSEDPTFLDLLKNAFLISSKLALDLTPRRS